MIRKASLITITIALLNFVNADIIISDLLPRSRQTSSDGSITLKARVTESNPSNFIRQAKFELQFNGNKVTDGTVTNPNSSGVYSFTVRNLAAGSDYCFRVQARNRFFLGSTSDFACFSIVVEDDSGAQPIQPALPARYGLQEDCFVNQAGFNICLDLSSPSGVVEPWFAAYTAARAKWESAVTFNGINSQTPSFYDPAFTATGAYPANIDGLYIASRAEFIDGPGGTLGLAGPVYVQNVNGRILTATGRMRFDVDDIQRLVDKGTWDNLILHEMGHVLGIGTLWDRNNIINGQDAIYRGAAVNREWAAQGCRTVGGFAPVVELDGGRGTAFGHFDEECFGREIMTGFVGSNTEFSQFTVATLQDLGYSVDYNAAQYVNVPAQCCNPPSRRRLNDPAKQDEAAAIIRGQDSKRRLSAEMMEVAMEYGREELSRLKQLREELQERFGADAMEDVETANFVNVLVEEGGEIFDVVVSDEDEDEDEDSR